MTFVYRTYVYKNPENVTLDERELEELKKALDDWESHKKDAVKVDDIIYVGRDVVFIVNLKYAEFSAKIDGTTYNWGDVRYRETDDVYELVLVVV